MPYLLYALGPSQHHRQLHESWQGVCLPVDDPWWDTHYTPNGWGCKCYVRQVTSAEYSLVSTWIHELGHQVHFRAGTPRGASIKTYTQYARSDRYERHAEGFVLWLLAYDDLRKSSPETADYFDELIEMATNATVSQ